MFVHLSNLIGPWVELKTDAFASTNRQALDPTDIDIKGTTKREAYGTVKVPPEPIPMQATMPETPSLTKMIPHSTYSNPHGQSQGDPTAPTPPK